MADKFASATKDALVDIVKLSQKRGMRGNKGGWKEFLTVYDKKFGASMSDPSKRTPDVLRAFLSTFEEEQDLNFLANFLKCYTNRESVKQLMKSQDTESPEQKLVRLTLENPLYQLEYSFPSFEEDWVVTKLRNSKSGKSSTLLAVDCEMVLCEDGTEALVKICVVDQNLGVKLHKFVNPNKEVADYRTEITGVSAKDMDGVTYSLADVQKKMKKLLSRGTILVGHSLSNDLKVLKIDHARVIDTSYIFKYGDGTSRRRPSLNDLCKSVLGFKLREKGGPHNCFDDACAAMKLTVAKLEKGYEDVLPAAQNDIPESERAKLFLHKIPKDLPCEELHQFIPGDYTIEILTRKKGGGDTYSAFAIFESQQGALAAYKNLQGDETKDTFGRLQKPVSIKLKSGSSDIIYARKMSYDSPSVPISTKRSCPDEVAATESKRLKTEQNSEASKENQCIDHLKEIERLKESLSDKDKQISRLQQLITALARKQGLL